MQAQTHKAPAAAATECRAAAQAMGIEHMESGFRQKTVASTAIYLSWNGEIYGPATETEIIAGIRTSSFEEGTLYWHESLDEWRELSSFPFDSGGAPPGPWTPLAGGLLPVAPSLPATAQSKQSQGRKKAPRHGKSGRAVPLDRRGLAIVFGFVLLAVLLTVGILLLLMLA